MKAEENKKSGLGSKRKCSENMATSMATIFSNGGEVEFKKPYRETKTTQQQQQPQQLPLMRADMFSNATLLPSTISYNSAILPDAIFLTTSSGQLITTSVNPTQPISTNILQEKNLITTLATPLLQQQHSIVSDTTHRATLFTENKKTVNKKTSGLKQHQVKTKEEKKSKREDQESDAAAMASSSLKKKRENKKKNKKKKTINNNGDSKPSATLHTLTSGTADDNIFSTTTVNGVTSTTSSINNIGITASTNLHNNLLDHQHQLNNTIFSTASSFLTSLETTPSTATTNGFISTPLTSIAGIIEQVKVARARNGLTLATVTPLHNPPQPATSTTLEEIVSPDPLTTTATTPTGTIDTSSFLNTPEDVRRKSEEAVPPQLPSPPPQNITSVLSSPPSPQPPHLFSSSPGLPSTTYVVTNGNNINDNNSKETSLDIHSKSLGATATFTNFPLIASGLTGFTQTNFTTFSLQAPLLTPGLTIPLYNSLVTVSAKDGVLPSLNKEIFATAAIGTISNKTTAQKKTKSKKKNSSAQQHNGIDMTTSRGRKRTAQSRLPAKLKEPAAVARRNARERRRVKMVNDGFLRLRRHVPTDPKNKKLSKVKTLRLAIEYIHHLQQLLNSDSTTKQTSQSIVTSFTEQMSNYDDLDDETAEWLQPDSLVSPLFMIILLLLYRLALSRTINTVMRREITIFGLKGRILKGILVTVTLRVLDYKNVIYMTHGHL